MLIFICHRILFILPCAYWFWYFNVLRLLKYFCFDFTSFISIFGSIISSIDALMLFWIWGKGQCTCATHERSNLFIYFHPHFWLRGLSSSMNHSRPLSLFSFTNFDLVDACDHGLDNSYYAHSFGAIGPSLWTYYGSDLLRFWLLLCKASLIFDGHFIVHSTWWQKEVTSLVLT